MKTFLKIFLIVFVVIQFFRIDKTNPPADKTKDFLYINNPPKNISAILKASCYDCHSDETVYPWYTNIQPVGWFLKSHIEEGRSKLNFSTFADYDLSKQVKKAHKAAKEITEGGMPLESYLLIHRDAKLTAKDKELLSNYLLSIK